MPSLNFVSRVTIVDIPSIPWFILHYVEYLNGDRLFLLLMFNDPQYFAIVHNILHCFESSIQQRIELVACPPTHLSIEPDHALKELVNHICYTYFPMAMSSTSLSNDWLLSFDSDEFLYFHDGYALKQFLFGLPDHISQAQFPWILIDNNQPYLSPHPYQDILDLPWYSNPHVKSGVRIHQGILQVSSHLFRTLHHTATWVSHHIHPSSATQPLYYSTNVLYPDASAPVIFHCHSQSLATTFNKVLYQNFAGKSGGIEKQTLVDAVYQRNVDKIRTLGKVKLLCNFKHCSQLEKFTLHPRLLSLYETHRTQYSSTFLHLFTLEKNLLSQFFDSENCGWLLETTQQIINS